jgi:hypothetical protein
MQKRAVMAVQDDLKRSGLFPGAVDGALTAALAAACDRRLAPRAGEMQAGVMQGGVQRKAVAVLQLMCRDKGIDPGVIDGFWGPVTDHAWESLEMLMETGALPRPWRDEEPSDANPQDWPRDTGNQAAMKAFYGVPGAPPIRKVPCPWPLRLAWNTRTVMHSIGCHAKVADSLGRVLTRVHGHYGTAELQRLRLDLFGGCFANRKKRGGTSWSTHAWAVALDWDPARNPLNWGRDKASLDHPDYLFWWEAWEAEGWVSLGRSRNFDWMHVQAARL